LGKIVKSELENLERRVEKFSKEESSQELNLDVFKTDSPWTYLFCKIINSQISQFLHQKEKMNYAYMSLVHFSNISYQYIPVEHLYNSFAQNFVFFNFFPVYAQCASTGDVVMYCRE